MGIAKRSAVTIYGIKNCDTMKKARTWLDSHGVEYAFHDYKVSGIDRATQLFQEQWGDKTPTIIANINNQAIFIGLWREPCFKSHQSANAHIGHMDIAQTAIAFLCDILPISAYLIGVAQQILIPNGGNHHIPAVLAAIGS